MSGGTLFIAATPIGNLSDASDRLRTVLAEVDLVLCEDTRRTGRLLKAFGVEARMRTCHEHDEERRLPEVLELLREGGSVALVSDAGTPLISDPGYRLVSAVHAAGLRVSPVPGPSAVLAALSVSGLATDRFVFEGFLPRRALARRRRLVELAGETRTLVLLEAPHRAAAALKELAEVFGEERPACLCRELSKLHEEVRPGGLGELRDRLAQVPARGELVLVVGGAPAAVPDLDAADPQRLKERVSGLVAEGLPEKEALRQVARETGLPRREVYRIVKLDAVPGPEPELEPDIDPEFNDDA